MAELDDPELADAIVFRTPPRFGLPATRPGQFVDRAGGLWVPGEPANKVVSSFASAATALGGQESAIVALNNAAHNRGGIIVVLGHLDPIRFAARDRYAAPQVSNNGVTPPEETALATARFRGRRVAEVAAKLAGVPEPVAAA